MKILVTRNNLQKRRVKKKTRRTKDRGNTELTLGISSEVRDLSGREVSRNIVVNRLRTALDSITEFEKRIKREFKKIGGDLRKSNQEKDSYVKNYEYNTKVRDIYKSFKRIKSIVNGTVEKLVFIPVPDDRDNIFDTIDIAKKHIKDALSDAMAKDISYFKDIEPKKDHLSLNNLKEKYDVREGDRRFRRVRETPKKKEVLPKIEKKEEEKEFIVEIPQKKNELTAWIPHHHYTHLPKKDIIKAIEKGKMSSKGWDGNFNFIDKKFVEEEYEPFPKNRGWNIQSRLKPSKLKEIHEFKIKLQSGTGQVEK